MGASSAFPDSSAWGVLAEPPLTVAALAAASPGGQKEMVRKHRVPCLRGVEISRYERMADVLLARDKGYLLAHLRSERMLRDRCAVELEHWSSFSAQGMPGVSPPMTYEFLRDHLPVGDDAAVYIDSRDGRN